MYAGIFVLAMIVFGEDIIKSILSINLFVVAFAIFVGYTVKRGNTEAKKKVLNWLEIAIGGVVLLMVHFYGVIGIITVPIRITIAYG